MILRRVIFEFNFFLCLFKKLNVYRGLHLLLDFLGFSAFLKLSVGVRFELKIFLHSEIN